MSEKAADIGDQEKDQKDSRAPEQHQKGISAAASLGDAKRDVEGLIREFEVRAWELSRRPDLYAEADAQGLVDELLEDVAILEGVLAVLVHLDGPPVGSTEQGSLPI